MIAKKEEVTQRLRKNGISPSYPRKRILEYLIEKHNHPTAARIYDELVGEIPSLSKTTVYNSLKLFVEKNLAEEITIEGTEKRYDLYNPEGHAHFRCDECGKLFDIAIEAPPRESKDLQGFTVLSQSVHFTGICPDCSSES